MLLNSALLAVWCAFVVAVIINVDKIYAKAKLFLRQGGTLTIAWVFMFLATGLWTMREEAVTGVGSLDVSAEIQITFVGIASFLMILKLASGANLRYYGMLSTASFLTYGLLGFMSAGVSPAPALTIYKSGLILADSLLVVLALSTFCKKGYASLMLEITYSMGTLFLCGIVLGGILFPDLAVRQIGGILGYNLNGVFPVMNANDVGFFAAIAVAIGLRRMWEPGSLRGRLFWSSLTGMGFVVLFFAQARTSIVAVAIVLVIYAIAIKRMRLLAGVMAAGLVSIAAFYLLTKSGLGFEDSTVAYLKRGQTDQMVDSLSGREGLWAEGLAMFKDAPLLGHGFEAGVKYGGIKYGIAEGLHMHNAHMQVLVDSGMVGYIAWVVFVSAVAIPMTIRAKKDFPATISSARFEIEMFCVMLIMLLRTMTGSVLVFHHYSLLLLLSMLIYLKLPKSGKRSAGTGDDSTIPFPDSKRILAIKNASLGAVSQK